MPNLEKLILPRNENAKFMKAMRAATKEWDELTVQLVSISETKKWGDWDLEKMSQEFNKGRKVDPFKRRYKQPFNPYRSFQPFWT